MDLESRALAQFDRLVEEGELLWKKTPPRYVKAEPFNFQFRIATSMKKKPIHENEDDHSNAFEDDDPDFEFGNIGPKHKLILNKFSILRPQFVLPTIEFEPQSEPLNIVDFRAVWNVLSALGSKYMAIYNCGLEAGASVPHKHLQIFPQANHLDEKPFSDIQKDSSQLHGVPFQHAVQLLPSNADSQSLLRIYDSLRASMGFQLDTQHNMILTKRWIMVVPRSKGWIGEVPTNAAGMVGMVFCKSEKEYQGWMDLGPMEALKEFGVPRKHVES